MTAKNINEIVSDVSAISVSHVDRLYIRRGLEQLIAGNDRSVKKETSADIVSMRNRETEMLRALSARFGG